ncbi:MAG: PadR family transcriptional regulator [Candidatus Magasanikbacteria bacterium]|jgi:PadR family transcriptional regulator, regulatory protein PadR|nr:PadR family transcriptional regulator [Candidatus Magasanikbacteria bacterium]
MATKIENTKAQMRKGFLEFCTLLVISKNDLYAADILQELTKADLIVVEGTLYPLLSRLRRDGFLTYVWQESPSGPPRKYYSLTADGQEMITSLSTSWKSLSKSINRLVRSYEKSN